MESFKDMSKEKALIILEERKKELGYQKLTDMVSDGVQSRDPEFISALVKALGVEKISSLNERYLM